MRGNRIENSKHKCEYRLGGKPFKSLSKRFLFVCFLTKRNVQDLEMFGLGVGDYLKTRFISRYYFVK